MADPVDPTIASLRSIVSNLDYVSNWITAVVLAGGFSALISFKDKATGAALIMSFLASTMLAIVGWPIMLQYGYGGLIPSIAGGVVSGMAGLTILVAMISIIRRVYVPKITDMLLPGGQRKEDK